MLNFDMMSDKTVIKCLLLLAFAACSKGPASHLGYWIITEDEGNDHSRVIDIRRDSLALLDMWVYSGCDTSFSQLTSAAIIGSAIEKHRRLLTVVLDDDTMELIIRIDGQNASFRFGSDDRIEATKVEGIHIREEPTHEDVTLGYRWSLAESFLQVERQTTMLLSKSEISPDAQNLLLYIDSLRSDLLSGYGLVYSDEQCWWKLEVLGTWRQNTKYMIGDDPGIPRTGRFTADELHGRLLNYLEQAQLEVDVITIFPEYANALDWIRDAHGMPVTWIAGKFYNVTLGATLAELHRIKLGIVQLERLKVKRDSMPQ